MKVQGHPLELKEHLLKSGIRIIVIRGFLIEKLDAHFTELDHKYDSFGTQNPEINEKPMEGLRNVISE